MIRAASNETKPFKRNWSCPIWLVTKNEGRPEVSTIITTNLDLPDWYALFDKKPLVDALLDRLQHHCVTIRIDGPSLRNPDPPATPPASPPRRTGKA